MDTVLVVYAFSAGMVATINPCGFAMLPAYVSYYLTTGQGNPGSSGTLSRLWRALLVGGTLTAGFLTLFILAGTLISLGVRALIGAMPWIGLLVGMGLVLLGGWLLLGRHLTLPGLPPPQVRQERSLRGIFLFGVAYGLASLSCTLPVFLVVVGSTFTRQGIGGGLIQFLAYGLGMGIVLMALTLSLALFEGVLVGHLRRLVPYVERVSAILLLGAGVYIVSYWLTKGQLLWAIP